MLSLVLATLASAAPPDAAPGLIAVQGAVDRLAASPDGALITGRAGRRAFVASLDDWEARTITGCDATGVASIPLSDRTWDVWVSCKDGSVRLWNFDGDQITPVTEDGAQVRVELSAGLEGVWFHPGSSALYALSTSEDLPQLHVVDPATFQANEQVFQGYPVTLGAYSGFKEAVLSRDQLIIHHGGDDMTAVYLGPTPSGMSNTFTPVSVSVTDLSPSPNGAYVVGTNDQIAEYVASTQLFQVLMTGLDRPGAVVASFHTDDPWLAVLGRSIQVWEMSSNGTILDRDDPFWTSSERFDEPFQDAITVDGYLFAGSEANDVLVATARPWVYPSQVTVSPDAAAVGVPVTLRFQASQPGDWKIHLNGDRTGSGKVVAQGKDAGADEEITVEITVDDDWREGNNYLYVVFRNRAGLAGHARASVLVDNPPDPPALTKANLGFADGALLLAFPGISDEDLDRYEVYVTTTPFSAKDWPSGGPEYDGTTRLSTPISVTKAGGEPVSYRIAPLENHVKHYVAVRAWDQGGLEGPMSRVISETPRPAHTAGELAGETGGAPCSTAPGSVGWMALLVGGAAVIRRRGGPLAAAALASCLFMSGPAEAQEKKKREPWRDMTPVFGDFEIRYGVIRLQDDHINSVYDKNPSNILQIEAGPQFFRVFEVDFGVGFFQELSHKKDEFGIPSADKTMLTMFPLSLDGTFRLHVVDEQFLVPHARLGLDYILYSEKADDGLGGKEVLRGAKTGMHWGVGVGMLLDVFARRRASLLEAQTGINDTYLVFEWRRQSVDDRLFPWSPPKKDGFDFSGNMITVGIKLDY